MEWTQATIAADTREWLEALPERLEREDFLLVHGSPRDPTWEYVTTAPVARAGIAAMPTTGGLHGHTHVPIAYVEDDGRLETVSPGAGSSLTLDGRRVLLNPGSVGQPRDGIPAASWMLLETDTGLATWQRTAYDVASVQAAMEAHGPARAAGRPPVVWPLGRGAHDRRPPADQRAEARRQARPRRAPSRALLPLHRPGPDDGQGRRQRPDDHARGHPRAGEGRAPRAAAGQRGGDRPAPVQDEGARDLQLGRDLVLGLRDRGDHPRVRPGRGRGRWRSTSPCRSRSRSPRCSGSSRSATARSASPTPTAAGRTRSRRPTSAGWRRWSPRRR